MYNRIMPNPRNPLADILTTPQEIQRPSLLPPSGIDLEINTPANQPAPNLLDQYKQIIGNHPVRDQLMQAMTQAPNREDYKPNWKDRIAAGLIGFSSGAGAGQQRLHQAYNDAESGYQDRLKKLGILAGMENQDTENSIHAIDSNANETRHQQDLGERKYEFDTGESNQFKKLGLTQDFSREMERMRETNEEKLTNIREAGDDRRTGMNNRTSTTNARIAATSRESVAESNNAAKLEIAKQKAANTLANLKARMEGLKPDDVNRKVYNDLAVFAAQNPTIDLSDYVDADPVTKRILINPDRGPGFLRYGDSPEDKAIKDRIRAIVESGYKGSSPNAGKDPLGIR